MDSNTLTRFFEKACADICDPVKPEEVIKPTRVVYRAGGMVTCRVFPTEERAYVFAAETKNVIVIQDVKDKPPGQERHPNRDLMNQKKGLGRR